MTDHIRTTAFAFLGVAVLAAGCGHAAPRAAAIPAPTQPATPLPATTTTALPVTTTLPATTLPATTVATRPPAPTSTAPCTASLPGVLATTGGATQLIIVEAPAASATVATVELWQRRGRCWTAVAGPWTGRIGANGFSDHHREGDDTTPTGLYRIGPVVYGNAPNPGVRGAYRQLGCGDWWDEDPASAAYNTFQPLACGQQPPFAGDSEALWTETVAYPSFAVVEYNDHPVVAGAGSAIFVHADIGRATAGCVSLPLGDLDQLLRWLDPAAAPAIVMGPTGELARF